MVLPMSPEVLRGVIEASAGAPDELSVIADVMEMPPLPFLPEEHHGQRGVLLTMIWAGDPAGGAAAVAPFRELATPLGEMVGPMPYPAIYEFSEGAGEPNPNTIRSAFLPALDESSATAIVDALEGAPAWSMVQLRALGGAMARVPADATAFAQRDAAVLFAVINVLGDPESTEATLAWNRGLFDAVAPMATGVYVNFLQDEGPDRIRAAYPNGAFERLVEVKRRYDPTNLFHRNQNIRPT
jgi:Berberine and berberine like